MYEAAGTRMPEVPSGVRMANDSRMKAMTDAEQTVSGNVNRSLQA